MNDEASEQRRPMDLSRVKEAHLERGVALREPDADRRIITRAKVRTEGHLVKVARVGRFTFQSDEAAMLGGTDTAPKPAGLFRGQHRVLSADAAGPGVCARRAARRIDRDIVRSLKEQVPVEMALKLNGEAVEPVPA